MSLNNYCQQDNLQKEAEIKWTDTLAYSEYKAKARNRSHVQNKNLGEELMATFKEFGDIMNTGNKPGSDVAQLQVKKLQKKISKDWFTCTKEILQNLGNMYMYDDRFCNNIDNVGGIGCAKFVNDAIKIYCK